MTGAKQYVEQKAFFNTTQSLSKQYDDAYAFAQGKLQLDYYAARDWAKKYLISKGTSAISQPVGS